MAKIEVVINQGVMADLLREIAEKIERTDADLRANWTGRPLEEVEPRVADGMFNIGVDLPADSLRSYSQSITDNENFEFVLG